MTTPLQPATTVYWFVGMAPSCRVDAYNRYTTQQPIIYHFAENSRFINALISVGYKKVKICERFQWPVLWGTHLLFLFAPAQSFICYPNNRTAHCSGPKRREVVDNPSRDRCSLISFSVTKVDIGHYLIDSAADILYNFKVVSASKATFRHWALSAVMYIKAQCNMETGWWQILHKSHLSLFL